MGGLDVKEGESTIEASSSRLSSSGGKEGQTDVDILLRCGGVVNSNEVEEVERHGGMKLLQ